MSKVEELRTAVGRARAEELQELFGDIQSYCKGAKGRGVPSDFIQYIHSMVKDSLSPEKLASLVKESEPDAPSFAKILAGSPPMQRKLAEQILGGKFKKVRSELQGDYYCEVLNTEHKILRQLNSAGCETAMMDSIAQYMTENHITVPTSVVTEMKNQFVLHIKTIPDPKPACRHDEEGWCFHKPLLELKKMDMPTWNRILKRMSDPVAFLAWVYGVYSGCYLGRRVMWLHGAKGEDGKSLIAKTLADTLFGHAAGAICNAQLTSKEKRFVTSFFVNTRLVIYPDASNTKILKSELFKMIASAGSDKVTIEPKGKPGYSAELSARLWVSSNYPPVITEEGFVKSRVQYILIDAHNEPPDPTMKEGLISELPGFLYLAKKCWEKLNVNGYDIQVNDRTQRLIDEIIGDASEEYNQIFSNLFEVSSNSGENIAGKDMKILLESEGLKSSNEQKDFHDWLLQEKGVQKIKTPPSNTFVYTNLCRVGHGKKVSSVGKLEFGEV